jgi:hypothetical protein
MTKAIAGRAVKTGGAKKKVAHARPGMVYKVEVVRAADVKPHPRNYREHPDDQVDHIVESIRSNGFYRNIIVSRDGYALAGHGVLKAAIKMGLKDVPVVRVNLDHDDPRAWKILTGDNEISRLAEIDDRALTEMLRDIKSGDPSGLLGTGFDNMMLANLVMITRPEGEIKDLNEAAEYVGMPEYEAPDNIINLIICFKSLKDKAEFARVLGLNVTDTTKTCWWPPKKDDDPGAVRFEEGPR